MPLMPIIGAISFYISYWVDKFMFCKFYRTPPMYSDETGKTSTKIIGLCVILHLIMSAWMMGGDNKVFKGQNYWKNKDDIPIEGLRAVFFKSHLLIIEGLLILYILGFFLSRFSTGLTSSLLKFLQCLCCCTGSKTERLKSTLNTVDINYTSARHRGVIKGIASYNILQNPK